MMSAEISFPATRARAIADNMTEAEMKAPNETTLARRRELGAREEVDELIKAHARHRASNERFRYDADVAGGVGRGAEER